MKTNKWRDILSRVPIVSRDRAVLAVLLVLLVHLGADQEPDEATTESQASQTVLAASSINHRICFKRAGREQLAQYLPQLRVDCVGIAPVLVRAD
jgi:hypothetical protein